MLYLCGFYVFLAKALLCYNNKGNASENFAISNIFVIFAQKYKPNRHIKH